MNKQSTSCPCGSTKPYSACCARYLDGGESAPTAEALMRSRYTAYTLVREGNGEAVGNPAASPLRGLREDYLLATWHSSTRPATLGLAQEAPTKWLGLQVKRHEQQDDDHAIVEFVARYKIGGRAQRLHEVSSFVREEGRWYYVRAE